MRLFTISVVSRVMYGYYFFFFQAEDGIRDLTVTGVQTCALPLAASPARCTVAYWHHPRFFSGSSAQSNSGVKPLWDDLYAAGAEVVINAHYENYERFALQAPDGTSDAAYGIRDFVVGTGG